MSLPPNPDDPRPAPPLQPSTTAGWPQSPSGPPTGPPSGPPIAPPPGMPGVPPPMFGSSPGNRVSSGGSSRTILIAVVSVLVLVAAGFAVVNLQAGGQAGASSPDAAVDEMFGAIADEDAIGVMEEMVPAERDVLRSWFEDLESNLSDLGLIDDVNLGDIEGVDLEVGGSGGSGDGADVEVDGLQTSAEEVMPGVSKVTITGGRLSFETVPDAVPVGDVLEGLIEANGGEVDIERTSDEVDFAEESEDEYADPVFLVATEQDGRWYLSLSYTIAEYARLDSGEGAPAEGAGVAPQGADSAEAAADEFITAAADLDVERLISLLPPDSMGALQTYAPLFLEDAEAEVDELVADEGYEASVEGLEFDTSSVDGGTRVVPTAGTGTFTFYDGDVTVSLEDRCIEATGEIAEDMDDDWGTSVVCQDDLGDLGGDLTEEERAELDELGALFTDYQAGLVVVERDGAFYVDPLRTFGDLTLQMFDGVDRADLEEGGILYRLFTGESVLFEEDYDYEDDYSDEDDEDEYDDGYEDEYDEEEGAAETDSYELGYDAGYDAGLADGAGDAAVESDYGANFDDAAIVAPSDVEDVEQYEYGYLDGYYLGYDDGFFG